MNPNTLCVGCMEDDSADPICPKCGSPFDLQSKNSLQLKPRTLLRDQYLIGRTLGHGGFGITYLAWDVGLETRLAIKEYMPNGVAGRSAGDTKVLAYSEQTKQEFDWGLDRFLEEARVLKKFRDHPGIVSIDTIFRDNGTAYLVMEFLDGMTFEEFLGRRGGKITFETGLRVMLPVLDALSAVHAEGILHRDISPDNIHLARNGKVKLIDFGAARNALSQKSRNLSIILKEGYAPEEQYRASGIQGPWTDVYATAATLYHAVTGQIPQPALDRQAEDKVERPSKLGVEIEGRAEAALMKALAIKTVDRFQSMEDFKAALTGNIDVRGATRVIDRNDPRIQALEKAAPPPPPPAPPPPAAAARAVKGARPSWMWPAILGTAALAGVLVVMNRPTSTTGTRPSSVTSTVTSAVSGGGASSETKSSAVPETKSGAEMKSSAEKKSVVETKSAAPVKPAPETKSAAAPKPSTGAKAETAKPPSTEIAQRQPAPVNSGEKPRAPVETSADNPPPNTPQPPVEPTITNRNRPPANPRGDYEGIANLAQQAVQRHGYGQAVPLLSQAIQLDPSKPKAYDMLAEVQLYELNQFQPAMQNYQAAIAHGGVATFHVYHDHGGGNFAINCKGWLHVSKAGVRYVAFDSVHAFEAQSGEILEAKKNRLIGMIGRRTGPGFDLHSFHIKLRNGQNYNFAPMSRFGEAERDLLLSFIGAR